MRQTRIGVQARTKPAKTLAARENNPAGIDPSGHQLGGRLAGSYPPALGGLRGSGYGSRRWRRLPVLSHRAGAIGSQAPRLAFGALGDFNQAANRKLTDERNHIALTFVAADFVLIEHRVNQFVDAPRLRQHAPDGCADLVEAIVDAGFEVQDSGLAVQVTGDLVGHRHDHRIEFDFDAFDRQA